MTVLQRSERILSRFDADLIVANGKLRDSLLSHLASLFLRKNSLFCPLGNSAANRLVFKGSSQRDGPNIGEVPCIFPAIREFNHRRAVRCGLPASARCVISWTANGFDIDGKTFGQPQVRLAHVRHATTCVTDIE